MPKPVFKAYFDLKVKKFQNYLIFLYLLTAQK